MVKQIHTRHKSKDSWSCFSSVKLWETLLADTKQHSKYHQVLSDICLKYIGDKFDEIIDDTKRIYEKCINVNEHTHEEIFKVINELRCSMKTYHEYQNEYRQTETKLSYVEAQKVKIEKQKSKKKLKQYEKQLEKRQQKYTDAKMKAFKARNEYILNINSVNACIKKYCTENIADLIDCMDFGFHGSIAKCIYMYISGQENIKRSRENTIQALNRDIGDLDSNNDKQKYLDNNSSVFKIDKQFEFEAHKGDQVSKVSVIGLIKNEVENRSEQLGQRLDTLKIENDEIFKTIEATEQSLIKFFDVKKNCDMTDLFKDLNLVVDKIELTKDKRLEIEDFYIEKFRQYTFSSNLIARLTSRHQMMSNALGSSDSNTSLDAIQLNQLQKPKKKIGKSPLIGQPRLFGGKLDDYLNVTKQDIPLIITSSIKAMNRIGLHSQGIFRIPGSLIEINHYKDSFEKGEDPLVTVNPREINSIAGVLKLYFRELKDPLFPREHFDEFINSFKLNTTSERVSQLQKVLQCLPKQIYIVMRYLFAFLNHLSEFKDENMMDSYNIAVCLAPTLIPVPDDKKEQVNLQTDAIDLIKFIIDNHLEIFNLDIEGLKYEKFEVEIESDVDDNESDFEIDESSEKNFIKSYSDEEQASYIQATGLYDYNGRSDKELSFKKGDRLIIKSQLSIDWWLGALDKPGENVKFFLVPDKYIELNQKNSRKDSNASFVNIEFDKYCFDGLQNVKESDILYDCDDQDDETKSQPSHKISTPLIETLKNDITPTTSFDKRRLRPTFLSSTSLSTQSKLVDQKNDTKLSTPTDVSKKFSEINRSDSFKAKNLEKLIKEVLKVPDLVMDLPSDQEGSTPITLSSDALDKKSDISSDSSVPKLNTISSSSSSSEPMTPKENLTPESNGKIKKQPPAVMKKPEKTDEILRALLSSTNANSNCSDAKSRSNQPKNKTTDV